MVQPYNSTYAGHSLVEIPFSNLLKVILANMQLTGY